MDKGTNEKISILVPTWNRKKFLPLLLRNIMIQDYPHNLIKVYIDDDGEEKLINDLELEAVREHIHPVQLIYTNNNPRRTIGKKRNDMVKTADTKIVCFMDDDDIYFPTYLSYSYQLLKEKKAGCVGSDKMTFAISEKDFDVYAINCGNNKIMIHEATMMFSKKWFKSTCKFANSSEGEGKNIFVGAEKTTEISDIMKIMCCLQHSGNTIDKLQFATDDRKTEIKLDPNLINILKKILRN